MLLTHGDRQAWPLVTLGDWYCHTAHSQREAAADYLARESHKRAVKAYSEAVAVEGISIELARVVVARIRAMSAGELPPPVEALHDSHYWSRRTARNKAERKGRYTENPMYVDSPETTMAEGRAAQRVRELEIAYELASKGATAKEIVQGIQEVSGTWRPFLTKGQRRAMKKSRKAQQELLDAEREAQAMRDSGTGRFH